MEKNRAYISLPFWKIFLQKYSFPSAGQSFEKSPEKGSPHKQSKVRWRFRKILWPSQNIWTLHVLARFYTFWHVFWQMRTWDAHFLTNKYLRCTFLHVFWLISTWDARFCTFLHIVCTWDTRTPAIKYWPSAARIFYSWTLYYIPLTL